MSVAFNSEEFPASNQPAFVSFDAVRATVGWSDAVATLRAAYAVVHSDLEVPPRTVARGRSGWLRTMSATPAGNRFMGAKIFGVGPKRMINYAIVLIEQDSGLIAGFVDGGAVTAIRTAATSAVAIDRLAKAGALRVGVLGSGDEARGHVNALAAIRPIESLKVFSPTSERREAFADDCASLVSGKPEAVDSADAAAADCDLLIAAARSRGERPIVHSAMLKPDMLTVSIGSTLPEQREVDVSAVAACDLIVCDAVEEVVNETGDMLAAREAGIDVERKIVSLNALMSGGCEDRIAGARQMMFKSVGSALQDIVIAELAFDLATRSGRIATLPVAFNTKFA